MKILVIEDSERLRRSLEHGLRRTGFAVDVVADGVDGLDFMRHGGYDAVVLDLMLPRLDGLAVLRRVRDEGNNVHVLILSARDQVAQRVAGLRAGADDYLTKPFDFDELVARLRALVRRRYGTKSTTQRVGDVRVDCERRGVFVGDSEVALTPQEYAVLEYLLARRGRVVSKPELLAHIYAGLDGGSENAVEVFVHQLRKKLAALGQEAVIRTRRGHGYLVE